MTISYRWLFTLFFCTALFGFSANVQASECKLVVLAAWGNSPERVSNTCDNNLCPLTWGKEMCGDGAKDRTNTNNSYYGKCYLSDMWRECKKDWDPTLNPQELNICEPPYNSDDPACKPTETAPTQCTDDTQVIGIKRYWDTSYTYGLTHAAVCSKLNGVLTHIGCQGKYASGAHAGEDFAAGASVFYARDLSAADREAACKPYNPDPPKEPETPTASEPKPPQASEPKSEEGKLLKEILEAIKGMGKKWDEFVGTSETTKPETVIKPSTGGSGGGSGGGSSGGGTGSGGTGGTGGGTGSGSGEGEGEGGLGGEGEFGVGSGEEVIDSSFSVHAYVTGSAGSCPAPIEMFGQPFSFEWICEVVRAMRPWLIMMASIIGAWLIFDALLAKDD